LLAHWRVWATVGKNSHVGLISDQNCSLSIECAISYSNFTRILLDRSHIIKYYLMTNLTRLILHNKVATTLNVQLLKFGYKWLLNRSHGNGIVLKGQHLSLKFYQTLEFQSALKKTVGQWASKLLSVNLWEWFKPWRTRIQADWFD